MAALALAAVGGLGGKSGVAFSANHLFAFVGSGERGQGGLDVDGAEATAAEAQHEVKRGLLLDVVVGESAAVLKLLAGEDQSLLVGGDALLVLDLSPACARQFPRIALT